MTPKCGAAMVWGQVPHIVCGRKAGRRRHTAVTNIARDTRGTGKLRTRSCCGVSIAIRIQNDAKVWNPSGLHRRPPCQHSHRWKAIQELWHQQQMRYRRALLRPRGTLICSAVRGRKVQTKWWTWDPGAPHWWGHAKSYVHYSGEGFEPPRSTRDPLPAACA